MASEHKAVIGRNAYVTIEGISSPVAAKIDTGADGTSLWVSGVRIDAENNLYFTYFSPISPLYDGKEHVRKIFRVVKVTSSMGHNEIRFKIKQKITLGGKTVTVWCTLTDRSTRLYPMLIGRRTLKNRFIVDVSISEVPEPPKEGKDSGIYREHFFENPEAILSEYRRKEMDK